MSAHALLADTILVFHLAYAGFVVLGFGAIAAGWALGWDWTRRRAWRLAHAFAIGLVGAEAAIGMACPLTVWEDMLRRGGSSAGAPASLIGRIASRLLYYDLPPWVFTAAYLALTALAIALWWLVPPQRRRVAGATAPGAP